MYSGPACDICNSWHSIMPKSNKKFLPIQMFRAPL